ncbi:type I-F CRISPR-associated endoribonuclease Cas6/Csy4 [Marinobacterium jannaschii]|uniref:type I-F CRISPR-associated endoribonuclease Cas6/Csy4 n=1 Tax=Marinobacterium jannaschii TaxID=64970 RepID=UPI0004876479|nr:type I-F CRISPR-associated endoribonuclease Cas6/Csy4 [Marinobacterium jannaschii]
MQHYLDIRILPDPEFNTNLLMNALFNKLHRALVMLQSDRIGVSFPRAGASSPGLGALLRLHGSEEALCQLMALNWLQGMRDHITPTDIRLIPQRCQYRCISRLQVKSSAERLRRRQMKRHGLSEQQARVLIPDSIEQRTKLPFLAVKSSSSGQSFKLFIRLEALQDKPTDGSFNCYGLSRDASVPWF